MIHYIHIDITPSETDLEPVDLEEVKTWVQVDFDDFDDMLMGMMSGARQSIEKFLNLSLVSASVEVDVEVTGCNDWIILPYSFKIDPSLLVVKDDNDAVIDPSLYKLKGNMLQLKNMTGCYNITYTITPTVPEALREAIKMEVIERFTNRGENQAMRANYDSPSLGLSEAAKAKAFPYQMPFI